MTDTVQERMGASLQLGRWWPALMGRIRTAEALRILNGGDVYRGTQDFGTDLGTTKPWGRLVVLPTGTLWPTSLPDGAYRGLGWTLRAEVNDFHGAGWDPILPLGRLQQIAWEGWLGWLPEPAEVGIVLRQAVYCQRPEQTMPEWDGDRQMWWTSSEWRTEASRPPA